jgi:hypothetical protein
MKIRPVLILGTLLTYLVIFSLAYPVWAAPLQQATETPDSTGNIWHIIQKGDTCTSVSNEYKILPFVLRQLNPNINSDCTNLQVGAKLLVGSGGPLSVSATPGPSLTPEPPTITPTPQPGTTQICVLLFNDLNGDALHETTEPAIAGGAISVTEKDGKFSKTLETAVNPDPNAYPGTCFVDVPEGSYNIGVAIPDNYNPTMSLTYALNLSAGDSAFVDFGAQARDSTASQPGNTSGSSSGGTSPLLGFLGGFLLLGGLGLGWYALRLRKPQSKLQRSGLLKR